MMDKLGPGLSYHCYKLENWTKYTRQQFSDIGIADLWEKDNQDEPIITLAFCLEVLSAGKGIQTEHNSFWIEATEVIFSEKMKGLEFLRHSTGEGEAA